MLGEEHGDARFKSFLLASFPLLDNTYITAAVMARARTAAATPTPIATVMVSPGGVLSVTKAGVSDAPVALAEAVLADAEDDDVATTEAATAAVTLNCDDNDDDVVVVVVVMRSLDFHAIWISGA